MTWQVLDQAAGDIQITPPNQEQPDDGSGYRQIAVQAQANATATLPWAAPFPLSLADSSHITQAWWSPPSTAPTSTQPTAAPASVSPVAVVVGVGAAAGLIWWLLRRR